MKRLIALLLFVALAVTFPPSAFATIKSVTSVGAAASTIVTPSTFIRTLVIQNNGSGDVRLGIDGGTVLGVTDPTATTGYLLKAGSQVIFTYPGNYLPPVIRAILVSGTTTTLAIVSDDTKTT